MSTSSWAFAAVFSRPERPSLIRGWADFSYSRNMWCVWLENLDLDFEFATTYEIQKWFLRWETRLCISFYLPSFENWPKKTAHKNSDLILHEHKLFVEKKNTKNLQILYRISKWNSKGNQWNPYLDFLIEIHLEDFALYCKTLNPKFWNLNPDFPIEPSYIALTVQLIYYCKIIVLVFCMSFTLQADVDNDIKLLTQKNEEITEVISQLESNSATLEIDDAVVTTAPLYNQ